MRNIETKRDQQTTASTTVESFISNTNITQLNPIITQGTGESNRIGNRIKPVRFTLDVALQCFNQAAGVAPTYFDVYVFKYKVANDPIGPSSGDMNRFLDNDNSATQYVGLITDGLRKLNDDLFQLVAKRRVLLFNPFNSTNHLAATSSLNPCKTMRFDLTKHVKKTWVYDDNTGLVINDNLWMAVGSTQSDGSTLIGSTGSYQAIMSVSYKDA